MSDNSFPFSINKNLLSLFVNFIPSNSFKKFEFLKQDFSFSSLILKILLFKLSEFLFSFFVTCLNKFNSLSNFLLFELYSSNPFY